MTDEQYALYARLMAEAEGWTDVKPATCGYVTFWNEKSDSPPAGRPPDNPDKADWRLPNYPYDLNSLARVARKICETKRGRDMLEDWLDEVEHRESSALAREHYFLTWQACLTAEELFAIYGEVLENLNKEKT